MNQTVRDKNLTFLEFKTMIRNFEENTKARDDVTEKMSVMKVRHDQMDENGGAKKRQDDYRDKRQTYQTREERQARGRLTCYTRGGEGHRFADCPTPRPKSTSEISDVWCHFCESNKHSYRTCRNKVSDTGEGDKKRKTYANAVIEQEDEIKDGNGEEFHSFSFSVKDGNQHDIQTTEEKQACLLVDSGATDHILNDKRKFVSFQPDYYH